MTSPLAAAAAGAAATTATSNSGAALGIGAAAAPGAAHDREHADHAIDVLTTTTRRAVQGCIGVGHAAQHLKACAAVAAVELVGRHVGGDSTTSKGASQRANCGPR